MEVVEDETSEDLFIMVWKGVPADPKKQRSMASYYDHCAAVAELKSTEPALYGLRMRVIKKWFASKDSSHANIYRHYHSLQHACW
jgi:hypothetical protein